jgi:broad specificity phosphatase PhoE
MLQRVRSAFVDIVRDAAHSPAGDLVLVSHGGALRALLCSLLHVPFERQWQLRLDHGSLSAIDFGPGLVEEEPTVTLALLNAQALPSEGDGF